MQVREKKRRVEQVNAHSYHLQPGSCAGHDEGRFAAAGISIFGGGIYGWVGRGRRNRIEEERKVMEIRLIRLEVS